MRAVRKLLPSARPLMATQRNKTSFLGIFAAIAGPVAVVIGLVWVVFVLIRRRAEGPRSKHGFSLRAGEGRPLSDLELAKQIFETFVRENDGPIRDVLADYASTNPGWEPVAFVDQQWVMARGDGRGSQLDDCCVRCRTILDPDSGKLVTSVLLALPIKMRERDRLAAALEKAIRRSKTGRRAEITRE